MSDQPGFRQPEPQQSPDYQATPEPYVPFGQDETTTSFSESEPAVGSQTEPMPTYPPAAPQPYAQPAYGDQPPAAGYAQPTPPSYGQQPPAAGYAPPSAPAYGTDYGQAPQSPYGTDYGQAPQSPYGTDYGQAPYGADYGQSAYGQQQPYGMAPYGQQPAYGYGQAEHPQATTILVLGILGFFVPIVPFVAWYMGGQIKKQIDAGAPYQWEGSLKIGYLIGKILGIIQIASVVLTIIWLVVMFGLLAANGF
ncbi:hypothetical protein [Tessaracoccus sp. G1721]